MAPLFPSRQLPAPRQVLPALVQSVKTLCHPFGVYESHFEFYNHFTPSELALDKRIQSRRDGMTVEQASLVFKPRRGDI
jgi:hypothetical protein